MNMKYLRRMIGLLLSVAIVAGMLSGCGNSRTEQSAPVQDTVPGETQAVVTVDMEKTVTLPDLSEIEKQELMQANQLGIPMDDISKETISGAEMMHLLDWFVGYAAPEMMDEWKSRLPALRQSDAELCRFDAMAALYLAAQSVGGDYLGHNYKVIGLVDSIDHSWDENYITWELFEGYDGSDFDCGDIGMGYLDGACYYYNLARPSYFSGEYPFSLDIETNSFTPHIQPTYAEAILAIVRLISSANPDLFICEPTETEVKYLSMADEKRDAFHAAVNDVAAKATGTVYYVSNEGADSNDGRSPESAWATPQYALSQQLEPGDSVLLERGGSWVVEASGEFGLTSSALTIPEGVTLGAYGTGEKPILQGCLESANDDGFWELYFDQGGTRIWKAAQIVYYCPVIVFNEGETWATPVMPGMDASGQYLNDDGSAFDVAAGLTKDLQFCCLLDLTESGIDISIENSAVKGALYLRCDKGNPAEVFESISVPQAACGLCLRTNAVMSDVALRYFTCNGAVMDGYDGFHSQSVTNCEVGWCGGLLKGYTENNLGIFAPEAAGGALQISSANVSVTGSYLHHCGPFTLIVAVHNNAESPSSCILHFEDIYIADNLIEYCGSGIHMGDYASMDIPGTIGYITNFVFENNMVMYSGYGWVREQVWRQRGGGSACLSAFETYDSAIDNDGIYIRGNVFYKSAFALFSLSEYHLDRATPVNALPVFSGNTYVQCASKPLLQKNQSTEVDYLSERAVRDILGDKDGTLVIVENFY